MEKDIGTLTRVCGHTFDIIYNLLFTTDRVIALIVQHPLDIPNTFNATALLFGDRLSRRSERSERLKIEEDRLHLYEEQTFDELVSNHRFNFEISYTQVESVILTRGLFRSRLIFHVLRESHGNRKIPFAFSRKQFPEAEHILTQVLSSKIHLPRQSSP
jgi:hypothetical protein